MNSIEIKNLTYSYPGASAPTLKDINLEIEKGDFLAIVGNNGCGKSTLCKVMNGLIPHFITGEFQGDVLVGGISTLESDIGTLAQKVGYVYQDFENQIVRPTVLDDASYACMNYGMKDYKERGMKALELCGLTGRENDYVFQLSGGQTHLLALAGAVSLGPEVLILDEPIAQLDPRHADLIYEILKDLNENQGKTIIVIEHHTEYIGDYCKNVLLLKDGRVEWKLPAREALSRVEELQASNIFPPQVTLAAYELEKKGKIPSAREYPSTVEEGKKAFRRLTFRDQYMEYQIRQKKRETSVEYKHAAVSYRSVKGEPRKIFEDLNLEISRGEKIALIGSNGAGKSTLMKMMTGLLKPSSGEVLIKDISTRNAKPENLSKYVSLVYQNPEDMFIKDSIENDISFAMKARGIDNWEERTSQLLERFRLTELKDRDGRLLSGGQMRRASLAIGIALNPEILLLDEPTANLDIATRKEIMRTLNDMKDITETVMIATHDMQLVCEWAQRIIVLSQGKIIADGTRDQIFGNQEAVKTAGIRPPEIFTMGQVLDKRAFCYTVDEFLKGFGG
ncbi:MAG TPA: ATP-binding cassette domain-containing protein [Candidatus Blautia merdipullorum]|uniref:ATP-binding cassette domain-containing protein n=1 Tax=Candidatus Blautia stercoripullorum TaxID=2838502 RepID=A0A9D2RD17_9FIRM|nr:ATP-binding cassette domain-containing protein [Candidatus Blautia merdipullorum]HJD41126.1 ATP-binding cassette domain-containing protein [Candidatus Blautia stercoripullorum]